MTDTDRSLTVVSSIEESTLRRIVSVTLALAGLLVLLGLVALLPAIDRLVAALAIPPLALLTAMGTLLVVLALIWVAPSIERAVAEGLAGPTETVTNVAAATKLLTVFVAVVIAYHGFAGALISPFEAFGLGGIYHLGFLLVGLAVLAAFTRRLYRCWEPLTALMTSRVAPVVVSLTRDGLTSD